ncbi:MAG: hypothetical protein ACRCZ9_11990 [Fusobacteriaceae bacterium]
MYTIDLKNRRIILETTVWGIEDSVINEFDKLEKDFLPNTADTYECELVLVDVDVLDEKQEVIGKETKAFARRVGYSDWLMEFVVEEYKKCK